MRQYYTKKNIGRLCLPSQLRDLTYFDVHCKSTPVARLTKESYYCQHCLSISLIIAGLGVSLQVFSKGKEI